MTWDWEHFKIGFAIGAYIVLIVLILSRKGGDPK